MKRLVTISIILTTIIALSVTSIFYASSTNEKMYQMLDEIESMSKQNNDNIEQEIISLKEFWDSKEHFLSIFVRHDEIEKVNLGIVTMLQLAKNEMYGDLAVQARQLRFYIDHILNRELPTYDNIL